jgi:hypothetical protein
MYSPGSWRMTGTGRSSVLAAAVVPGSFTGIGVRRGAGTGLAANRMGALAGNPGTAAATAVPEVFRASPAAEPGGVGFRTTLITFGAGCCVEPGAAFGFTANVEAAFAEGCGKTRQAPFPFRPTGPACATFLAVGGLVPFAVTPFAAALFKSADPLLFFGLQDGSVFPGIAG